MLSNTAPIEVPLIAGFRAKPEYAGTIHDDSSARDFGYRGALVPGIILYGNMADIVVQAWGKDWVARGTMQSQSRRPAYEGDPLTIIASPVREDAGGLAVDLELRDPEGNLVASGRATLPHTAPVMPDASEYPILPIVTPLRAIGPGEFQVSDRFGNKEETIDREKLRESLELFGQRWPQYLREGMIHPSKYPQSATHSALASYVLSTPSIYVSAHTQHLGIAYVGATLRTSGYVTAVYERKGNHYAEQRHVVYADETPVALVQRTSIYAARRAR